MSLSPFDTASACVVRAIRRAGGTNSLAASRVICALLLPAGWLCEPAGRSKEVVFGRESRDEQAGDASAEQVEPLVGFSLWQSPEGEIYVNARRAPPE